MYAAVAGLLGAEGAPLLIRPSLPMRTTGSETYRRARLRLSTAFEDPQLGEQLQRWMRGLAPLHDHELTVLGRLAALARRCARALQNGDMAAAADLWDEQWALIQSDNGRGLLLLAEQLERTDMAAIAAAGGVLKLMLDDDSALAAVNGPL